MKRRVAFLVNDGPEGPMAERARAFSRELGHVFDFTVAYRHGDERRAIHDFLAINDAFQPHVSYVLDLAYSGVEPGI